MPALADRAVAHLMRGDHDAALQVGGPYLGLCLGPYLVPYLIAPHRRRRPAGGWPRPSPPSPPSGSGPPFAPPPLPGLGSHPHISFLADGTAQALEPLEAVDPTNNAIQHVRQTVMAHAKGPGAPGAGGAPGGSAGSVKTGVSGPGTIFQRNRIMKRIE